MVVQQQQPEGTHLITLSGGWYKWATISLLTKHITSQQRVWDWGLLCMVGPGTG